MQEGDKINVKDFKKRHENINKMWYDRMDHLIERISDGQKVFFMSNSDIPRKEFKIKYPNNKIVYKPEDADVFIVCRAKGNPIPRTYQLVNSYYQAPPISVVSAYQIPHHDRLDLYERILLTEKPFVSDIAVKFKGTFDRLMTEEEKDKIGNMLSSDSEDMAKLGLTILEAFDVENNCEKFALVFLNMRCRWLLNNRKWKQIKNSVQEKYRNLNI